MYSDSLSLLFHISLCEAQKHVGRQHYIHFALDFLHKSKTCAVMAHQIPVELYLTEQNPTWTATGRWTSQNITFLWNPKVYYRVYDSSPPEALVILSRIYFTVSCYSRLNTLDGRPTYISRLLLFRSVYSHLLLVYIPRHYLLHSQPEDEASVRKTNHQIRNSVCVFIWSNSYRHKIINNTNTIERRYIYIYIYIYNIYLNRNYGHEYKKYSFIFSRQLITRLI